MNLLELAQKRCSIRKYASSPVEDEKLARELAGQLAVIRGERRQLLRREAVVQVESRVGNVFPTAGVVPKAGHAVPNRLFALFRIDAVDAVE